MTKPGKGVEGVTDRGQGKEESACGVFGCWSLGWLPMEGEEKAMGDFFGRQARISQEGRAKKCILEGF